MGDVWTLGANAMKLDAIVEGRPALMTIDGQRFGFERDGHFLDRDFSVAEVQPGVYSVLIEGRSYKVIPGAPGEISVNGRTLAAEVFDPRELRARKHAGTGTGRLEIAALMPGKVVRLLVARGDTIDAGQGLVVVEAMKMQNEMKSPRSGRVAEMKTKVDATVKAGEVLLVIE
ncbi:MAG: biotin/lipoyl-containing protein [Bryobacteraceae bacterium]|jgi:biotin carboxyl carrier protein